MSKEYELMSEVAAHPGCVQAKAIFNDVLGTRELLNLHYWAMASRCELRVARPSAGVPRVRQLLGANQIFAIYATLRGSNTDGRPPGLSRRWSRPSR